MSESERESEREILTFKGFVFLRKSRYFQFSLEQKMTNRRVRKQE